MGHCVQICPHVAAWGHNEALALAALGKFRNAYKLAWSAAEIMNVSFEWYGMGNWYHRQLAVLGTLRRFTANSQ